MDFKQLSSKKRKLAYIQQKNNCRKYAKVFGGHFTALHLLHGLHGFCDISFVSPVTRRVYHAEVSTTRYNAMAQLEILTFQRSAEVLSYKEENDRYPDEFFPGPSEEFGDRTRFEWLHDMQPTILHENEIRSAAGVIEMGSTKHGVNLNILIDEETLTLKNIEEAVLEFLATGEKFHLKDSRRYTISDFEVSLDTKQYSMLELVFTGQFCEPEDWPQELMYHTLYG